MKNIPLLLGTIIGTLLLIAGIAFFFSKDTVNSDQPVDQTLLLEGARHKSGGTAPKVVIVEFSDFQCPACLASEPLVAAVMKEFGDQVQLVYRHFPLDQLHPYARTAAIASEIAAEEGKFWQYHEKLFANQASWSELTSIAEVQKQFVAYAVELGLDESSFTAKIQDSSVYSSLVQSDVAIATKLNVSATPTFFVNGLKASAPQLRDMVASVVAESSTAQ